MTNEEQHERKLTGVQREVQERIVEAGLQKFKAVKDAGAPTDEERLQEKVKSLILNVLKTMKPIMQESLKKGIHDRQADRAMLASLFLQQLNTLTKDELVFTLAGFLVEETFNNL